MSDIYFDLTDIENTDHITLAIKVVSESFKDVAFNVCVKSDTPHTLYNKKNIKLVQSVSEDFKVLFTTKYKESKINFKIKILKSFKQDKSIFLIEVPNNAKDYDKYFKSFKELGFFKEEFKYGVLSIDNVLSKTFIESHTNDENFIGIIEPLDICSSEVDVLLTSIETSKLFISTLLYTIEFINKKNERPKKEGYFAKFFGNLSGSSSYMQPEAINYLLEEVEVVVNNKNQIIFVFESDRSYVFYFNLINRICNILYN